MLYFATDPLWLTTNLLMGIATTMADKLLTRQHSVSQNLTTPSNDMINGTSGRKTTEHGVKFFFVHFCHMVLA